MAGTYRPGDPRNKAPGRAQDNLFLPEKIPPEGQRPVQKKTKEAINLFTAENAGIAEK